MVFPDGVRPSESVVQKPEMAANAQESDLGGQVDILAGLSLRNVVADSTGSSFIVQDHPPQDPCVLGATGTLPMILRRN